MQEISETASNSAKPPTWRELLEGQQADAKRKVSTLGNNLPTTKEVRKILGKQATTIGDQLSKANQVLQQMLPENPLLTTKEISKALGNQAKVWRNLIQKGARNASNKYLMVRSAADFN